MLSCEFIRFKDFLGENGLPFCAPNILRLNSSVHTAALRGTAWYCQKLSGTHQRPIRDPSETHQRPMICVQSSHAACDMGLRSQTMLNVEESATLAEDPWFQSNSAAPLPRPNLAAIVVWIQLD